MVAPSPTKRTFVPSKLNYSVSGLPAPPSGAPHAGGQHALFQNSAGMFFLFVWNEQTAISSTAVPVTVNFNSHSPAQVVDFDLTTNPANATTALQTVTAKASITIQLATAVHVLVITY